MSNSPYNNKPNSISQPNDWHELSFQISIDHGVDWDEVDLRKWAQTVARFTALVMAKTTVDEELIAEDPEIIKTLIMGIKVKRISFVTDNELHHLIDEFGDTDDDI